MFYPRSFSLFFSSRDLRAPRPIAVKLPHDGKLGSLSIASQTTGGGGCAHQKLLPTHATFRPKPISYNCWHLSGTTRDIQNRTANVSRAIPSV